MFGHQDNQNDDLSVDPLVAMDNQARAADSTKTAYSDDNATPATAALPPPTVTPPADELSLAPPAMPPLANNIYPQVPADDSVKAVPAMPYDEAKPAHQATSEDLTTIKEQALQQLDPLMGQLDQTPEEKFRTTMMMIQAADNKSLIPSAYEAAQQIKDDKARAQALLDVVNEINYFSQHDNSQSS